MLESGRLVRQPSPTPQREHPPWSRRPSPGCALGGHHSSARTRRDSGLMSGCLEPRHQSTKAGANSITDGFQLDQVQSPLPGLVLAHVGLRPVEESSQADQVPDREVDLAAFDVADVGPVHPGPVCRDPLSSAILPLFSNAESVAGSGRASDACWLGSNTAEEFTQFRN